MLKFLRKQKVAKRIFYALAIIIVPSFILWGSATVIRDRNAKGYAGIVFGKKISYDEYRSTLQTWRNQLKIKFGDKANQIEKILDGNQAVWDRLIMRYGIKRMNIRISNDELTNYITSLPFLQKDGVFDPQLYELFLRYSLNTPARIFEEEVRENLKFQKLFNQVTQDIQVTEEEIKNRYIEDNEQIKVKYVCVLYKDVAREVNLTEDELKGYYDKNKTEFTIPIQADLNCIGIDLPQDATEAQKKEASEKMEAARLFLGEGNDLPKAEDKFGLKTQETGFFSLGDPLPGFDNWLPLDFADLFNLKEKEFTDVMQTPRGPYIFQLKEKRLDYTPSFEELKGKIKKILTAEKARELAKTKMDNYYSQITTKIKENSNPDLIKIADSLSLPVKETDLFSRYTAVPEIGAFENFNEAACNLKEGQISEITELPQGYFVVILISQRKPIDEEKFKKEKEAVQQELLRDKKAKVFDEFFASIRSRANPKDFIGPQEKPNSPTKSN
ncbi:MAG: SurA N-terminal domain-containing protein [Candidatus Omnitrophica bacterium]|nr:SurA N-terminal domain-containing protein [Candidatus Omnitrophota bacterium]MDD5352880.1 SurA N-terminal domain-containing protein [Candidatus Omnitrophota bacterium]MDD5550479.1 SurA N-terminal domain-containing protein [Candidatus Omnitrophota bacterium]